MGKLWQDIGKKQPYTNLAEETVVNVVLTSNRLVRPIEQLFKEHGLSDATYNILRILRGAGPDGRMCSEVGRQLISSVPDVTRLLDNLERRGLVVRERSAEDRRVVRVCLTGTGAKVLSALDEPLRALQERLLKGMSRGELRELNELLDALRAGVMGAEMRNAE